MMGINYFRACLAICSWTSWDLVVHVQRCTLRVHKNALTVKRHASPIWTSGTSAHCEKNLATV